MSTVIAVVGPTAVGKSDLSVALALRLTEHGLPAEIINADSMQLYQGMDIGTAKLTPEERRGVPHHLLDVWEVTQTANVADYQHGPGHRRPPRCRPGARPRGRLWTVAGRLDELDFPAPTRGQARLEAELAEQGPLALPGWRSP